MAALVDELSSFVQCCVGFCSGDEVFFESSIAGIVCLLAGKDLRGKQSPM